MRRGILALTLLLVGRTALTASPAQHPLTIEDRIAAQRSIEQVYWSHRIWPKENPSPKPPLKSVMSDELIRAKVEDYLRKSNALGTWWQRPITGEQLQAELDRMAKGSHDPKVLRELFAALGNDPYVIAETLGRQALTDRLIRNWYADDTRIHGVVRERVDTALASCTTADCMKTMGGEYRETMLKLRGPTDDPPRPGTHELTVDSTEWDAALRRLAAQFAVTPDSIPVGKLTSVEETADGFVVSALLSRKPNELVTASVVWRKQPFETWWASQAASNTLDVPDTAAAFTVAALPTAGCQDDTWSPTRQDFPDARAQHTAVWTGTEMIVWGGQNLTVALNSGGRYNPATDTWTATSMSGNVPDVRYLHTAIWTGTEMIVWGGLGDTDSTNTGGRYNPVDDSWKATSVGAHAPTARSSHTAVWTGTEMIVWGGALDSSGGRYNPSTDSWQSTSMDGAPTPRFVHTAVWTGTEMIVWGGYFYSGPTNAKNTGGRYNPSTDSWVATSLSGSVPSARYEHTALWTGTEMIVWGGTGADPTYPNVGGRYNPATDSWAPTSAGANSPSGRIDHIAIWTGTEMIVWGGWVFGTSSNGGGRYDPSSNTWRPTSRGANVPASRFYHSGVWTGNEMIVWGGQSVILHGTTAWLSTGARYNPVSDSWVPTSTNHTTPAARANQTAVWTGAELCVWGGENYDGTYIYFNSGGCYQPPTDSWKTILIDAATPSARNEHTAVWTGTEMIVWGGRYPPSDTSFDSGGRYSPLSGAWTATSEGANTPSARYSHSAVWTGTRMLVWGGWGGAYLNTGATYDPSTDSWSPTSVGGSVPSARVRHTAVWAGTEMIVWGGYAYEEYGRDVDTGGRYNPSTDNWTPTSIGVGVPAARETHTAVWTGSEMIIWGGWKFDNGYTNFNTGGRYSPATNTWTATSTGTGVPEARGEHAAVWTGLEMVVWGGNQIYVSLMRTGGRYNPHSDTWTATSTAATAPTERLLPSAVWTGSEMIVWGGEPYSSTGALYCAHTRCFDDAGPVNCDDGNPCTDDSCDAATGCSHVDNSSPCDDGNTCTVNDACSEGLCIGHSGCEDGLPCTADVADPAHGCACSNPVSLSGTACTDGNPCTVRTVCDGLGGAPADCGGGTLLNCNDGNPCTDDACDPAVGCVHTSNASACDDGNACTTADTCSGGSCHGGPPPDCEDGNVCTDDSCDDASGCTHTGNYNACDDGNPCNGEDHCYGGVCNHNGGFYCYDNNVCTTDSCDPAIGCVFTNNTIACEDGNACTTGDTCAGGTCHSGNVIICDDDNPCTNDSCNPSHGCAFVWNRNPCNDGNACTTGDRCDFGGCYGSSEIECDDHNGCTTDTCDPAIGCVFTNNANPCDDSNPCTSVDICDGGACRGTVPDDVIPCDDGSFCTEGDTCLAGSCRGTAIACDDHEPCTTDGCEPATGCIFINNTNACDDGNACTTGDRCGAQTLSIENFDGVTDPDLPAGWESSASDTGYPWFTRVADADTAPNSAFGADVDQVADESLDSPTIVIGSTAARLTFRNRWSFEGDNRYCFDAGVLEIKIGDAPFADIEAAGGSFVSGGYTGIVEPFAFNPLADQPAWCGTSPGYPGYLTTAVDLPAAAAGQPIRLRWRIGSDVSGAAIGQDIDSIVVGQPTASCNGGLAPNCNDFNPCTDDSCDPAIGCVHTNNLAPCDDGSACTSGDSCAGGACHGSAMNCDDGNPCTNDSCNPATGCAHSNNTNPCDDGSACTSGEHCGGGTCHVGTPVVCDDANVCTTDSCSPATGCVFTNNTAPCDDGNVCTTGDTCGSGTCNGGPAQNCDDGNPCTDDACNPATGCVHTNNVNICNDGNACTTGDTCDNGACHGGPGPNCSDDNPCTTDSCNPATGCAHINNSNPCDDGNPCTTGDTCGGGVCQHGGPTNCDDGNCCTIDSCDAHSGCVHSASTAAPAFTVQPSLGNTLLWPPQHGYVDFSLADTGVAATTNCGLASIQFASCSSSQPENGTGTGDGNTIRDCVYEPAAVHLRAERDGACSPIGRVYTMRMVAVDVCGNSTASNPFDVGVWNDRNSPPLSGSIRQAANGSGTYDTRPGLNGTYSAGCGVGGASVNGTVADHSDVDPEAEISQSASIGVGDLRLVKSTGATILLTWTEPAHAATINVTRFHVYRLDPATLFWTQLAEVPKQTTSYLDPGLSDGNDRQYKVTAVIK